MGGRFLQIDLFFHENPRLEKIKFKKYIKRINIKIFKHYFIFLPLGGINIFFKKIQCLIYSYNIFFF